MKRWTLALGAVAIVGACPGTAFADGHYTTIPDGTERVDHVLGQNPPCIAPIRYDDGTDDTPLQSPTLGWWDAINHQYLSILFTPPPDQSIVVESASWFSDFWVTPGLVDVTAMESGNSANSATVTIYVCCGGTWEVQFPSPITIPAGRDYFIKLCPRPGVWGVIGDDHSAPDYRSYSSTTDCSPRWYWTNEDFMAWSCAVPSFATPVRTGTWGRLKSAYR